MKKIISVLLIVILLVGCSKTVKTNEETQKADSNVSQENDLEKTDANEAMMIFMGTSK